MDDAEAREVLGLPPGADPRTIRRRFRELARQHHPDRGGDPRTFADVARAMTVLLGAPRARPRGAVARGRPSRHRAGPTVPADVGGDPGALVAALLSDEGNGGGHLRLVSVAPGSRRNRLASALPEVGLSVLVLRTTPEPQVRLTVRARAAHRAVSRLQLGGPDLTDVWTRRRGDAALELRCDPRPPGPTERDRAMAVGGAAARLLAALRWPLREWTPEG